MAMGFRWQLGPMADSATEPRWARNQSTFAENPLRAAVHTQASISGFQNYGGEGGLRNGIAATMKHFPGAGPNQRGMDSHSYDGRYNVFPGNNFATHLLPFQAAVDVGVAAVMPCYSVYKLVIDGRSSVPVPEDPYQVPAGFSPALMTDILKTQMGFTGMVTGDWGTSGDPYGNNAGLTDSTRGQLAQGWLPPVGKRQRQPLPRRTGPRASRHEPHRRGGHEEDPRDELQAGLVRTRTSTRMSRLQTVRSSGAHAVWAQRTETGHRDAGERGRPAPDRW